eukprot:TRINITY_DN2871_c1_g1_i1.p1 TRINITY_DN2871_c1_g1~~TRINITY_DN2871_c1_g1_i1.p1  ORF type:complete len:1085 (+),score=450.68 TRINITY_DN2871_c1_g1_i1:106-3255(+)
MELDRDKRIKVAVRCRPLHPVKERYDRNCVSRTDEHSMVMSKAGGEGDEGKAETQSYSFDFFFDEGDPQVEIYNEAVLDVVDSTLDGHNSTIFAYGQTGSGKTYTTLGAVEEKGESLLNPQSGVFLRVLTDFFLYKDRCHSTMHVTVLLSIVEIYNDEVRDLLNKKHVLQVREVGDDVSMPELSQEVVTDLRGVYRFFKIADSVRSVTATAMNDCSSRSHAVFIIDLIQQAKTPANPDPPTVDQLKACLANDPKVCKGDNPLQKSRICIVDLAGSERVKKSGVTGKAFKEATEINKSLLALRNVIKGLYEGQKHLPFRDSKLTRILRTCFADPNCKVLLCANISPTVKSFSETKSTLTFANQVKGIKATAVTVDPQAELEYLERFRRLEELGGDLRIAAVMHDFVLQTPALLHANEATDEASRKALVAHVANEYNKGVSKRNREREEKRKEEVQQAMQQMTKDRLAQLAEDRKRIEDAIEHEKKQAKLLEDELQKTKAGKEAEVLEKQQKTHQLKQQRREAADAVTALERQTQELREQLKDARGESFGTVGVDDAETRRVVTQELDRRAKAEQHHASTADFARQLLHLRNLQVDHFVNRQRMLPGQQKRSAVEACVHRSALAHTFCEELAGWICDRAARIAQKSASPGDGETPDHLIRQLPFDHFHGGQNITPGHFTDPSEPVGPTEPSPEDYEDEDVQCSSTRQARDDAARAVGVSIDKVLAALPSASGDEPCNAPFQYDLEAVRRQTRDADRRQMEAAEAERRRKAALLVKRQAHASMRARPPSGGDSAEAADRTYLESIYDAHGLSSGCSVDADVVRFLQRGGYLIKHSRQAAPHKRRFWLSQCRSQLCWLNDSRLQARRCSVSLKEVGGIILGQYSRVFKQRKATPATPGWHQSFSLVLRQQDTTLDLVAESTEDFEAWVLGIAAITGLEPLWGGDELHDNDLMHRARLLVSNRLDEVVKARDQHGGDMQKVFAALGGAHAPGVMERQDAQQDALYLSKGELRQMLQVDIFRASQLWKQLEAEGLVYDPHTVDQRFRLQSSKQGL